MSGKIVGMNKYGYGKDEYEGYGVSVTVDCGNGITMAYHHMVDGSNANLNIGDEVKAGQQIGQVGSTGILPARISISRWSRTASMLTREIIFPDTARALLRRSRRHRRLWRQVPARRAERVIRAAARGSREEE